jgi:hypothetical protein
MVVVMMMMVVVVVVVMVQTGFRRTESYATGNTVFTSYA